MTLLISWARFVNCGVEVEVVITSGITMVAKGNLDFATAFILLMSRSILPMGLLELVSLVPMARMTLSISESGALFWNLVSMATMCSTLPP